MPCTEDSFIQVDGGAVFINNAVDCTEDCFIKFGRLLLSSVILRWTLFEPSLGKTH